MGNTAPSKARLTTASCSPSTFAGERFPRIQIHFRPNSKPPPAADLQAIIITQLSCRTGMTQRSDTRVANGEYGPFEGPAHDRVVLAEYICWREIPANSDPL